MNFCIVGVWFKDKMSKLERESSDKESRLPTEVLYRTLDLQ
jgi:hypothetical protein